MLSLVWLSLVVFTRLTDKSSAPILFRTLTMACCFSILYLCNHIRVITTLRKWIELSVSSCQTHNLQARAEIEQTKLIKLLLWVRCSNHGPMVNENEGMQSSFLLEFGASCLNIVPWCYVQHDLFINYFGNYSFLSKLEVLYFLHQTWKKSNHVKLC